MPILATWFRSDSENRNSSNKRLAYYVALENAQAPMRCDANPGAREN